VSGVGGALGIRPGDVIRTINEYPVAPTEAIARLNEALASAQNVLILVNRQGASGYLAMSLENTPNGRADDRRPEAATWLL
jgi:hypothetical protein